MMAQTKPMNQPSMAKLLEENLTGPETTEPRPWGELEAPGSGYSPWTHAQASKSGACAQAH